MKREKQKCIRCEGTGKQKEWIEGRGFFAMSREMVEVTCKKCNGSGDGEYESFYDALNKRLIVQSPRGEIIDRLLRSDLEAGVLKNGKRDLFLVKFQGYVFLGSKEWLARGIYSDSEELKIYNIGPKSGYLAFPHEEMMSLSLEVWNYNDESKDWDGALEAYNELLKLLQSVDLGSDPLPFIGFKPGRVRVQDGFLLGESVQVAAKISAVTGFKYSPYGGDDYPALLEIHLGATSIKLTSRQGAEEAYELLMQHIVNKNVNSKTETV